LEKVFCQKKKEKNGYKTVTDRARVEPSLFQIENYHDNEAGNPAQQNSTNPQPQKVEAIKIQH
jgi:hypothetical protein